MQSPDDHPPTLNESQPAAAETGGRQWSVGAIVAITISIAALLISILEVTNERSGLRAEAWPYLEFRSRYNSEGFAILLTNKGVGPARVRAMVTELDQQPIENLDDAILQTLGPEDAFSYEFYGSSNPAPGVLSPDEVVSAFSVPWDRRSRRLIEAWSERFTAEVCYCSVYDECWISRLDGGDPEPTRQCE